RRVGDRSRIAITLDLERIDPEVLGPTTAVANRDLHREPLDARAWCAEKDKESLERGARHALGGFHIRVLLGHDEHVVARGAFDHALRSPGPGGKQKGDRNENDRS